MMYEIRTQRLHDGNLRRRWFYGAEQELIAWFDDGERLTAFQLCYDKLMFQKVLYWRQHAGLAHLQVEDAHKLSGLLHESETALPDARLAVQFRGYAQQLPQSLVEFVVERIREMGVAGR